MSEEPRNIIKYINETVDPNLQLFIRGHLFLEALLGEIIERSYSRPDALERVGAMFFNKVKLVSAVGKISEGVEDLLLSINTVRNKLAHKLDYRLTFDDVFQLVTKAGAAGIDFSDEGIFRDRSYSQTAYGIGGIVNEVMCNTFSHLIWENEGTIFNDEDISRFLG